MLFLILSLVGVRELVMNSISPSMKSAIVVGIGLFIAFIGLQNAGLILKDPGTAVKLNPHFASPDLVVFFFGLPPRRCALETCVAQSSGEYSVRRRWQLF